MRVFVRVCVRVRTRVAGWQELGPREAQGGGGLGFSVSSLSNSAVECFPELCECPEQTVAERPQRQGVTVNKALSECDRRQVT